MYVHIYMVRCAYVLGRFAVPFFIFVALPLFSPSLASWLVHTCIHMYACMSMGVQALPPLFMCLSCLSSCAFFFRLSSTTFTTRPCGCFGSMHWCLLEHCPHSRFESADAKPLLCIRSSLRTSPPLPSLFLSFGLGFFRFFWLVRFRVCEVARAGRVL